MVGILGSFLDRRTLRTNWPKMSKALARCGVDVRFEPMSGKDFMKMVVDDQRYQDFVSIFGNDDFLFYLSRTKVISVLAFVILLTVTKNLNPKNYGPWCEKRVQTFAGATGAKEVPDYLQSSMFPHWTM